MRNLLLITGFIFMFSATDAQIQNPNYYYAGGEPQYWTDDFTSVNIIVKNMSDYDTIVNKLQLLFSNLNDEVLADDEDDNIIVNSNSLKSLSKDYIINYITNNNPSKIAFFSYSKLLDGAHVWFRNEIIVKLKDNAYFTSFANPIIQSYNNVVVTYEGDNEYSIICQAEQDVIALANLLYDTSFVVYSTPDFYSEISLDTEDPYFNKQWRAVRGRR